MTSIGIIKVPDNLPEQIGVVVFFYPSVIELSTGAYTSIFPGLIDPLMSMNVYSGDLGLDSGIPLNVYALDTDRLTQVAGRGTPNPGVELRLGETADLPNGLGTVRFDGIRRFASLDIAYNPGQIWVLFFAMLSLAGITVSLTTQRRRVWIKKIGNSFEVAGLSKRDDPRLEQTVRDLTKAIKKG